MTATLPEIDPHLPMRDLLAVYPGAQRALFRKYHVGGCSSCGFAPTETLAQICARNPHMDLPEVTALSPDQPGGRPRHADHARANSTTCANAANPAPVHLLDIRTREEFDAVHIAGSRSISRRS